MSAKKLVPLLLVPFLLLSAACGKRVIKGEGEKITEERNLRDFSVIDISAPILVNIHIQSGAKPSLKFTGYRNLISNIKIKYEVNTLNIYSNDFIRFNQHSDVIADITVSSLSGLYIHGTSKVDITGDLTGKDFQLRVNGAGEASIEQVHLERLVSTISGAGHLELADGTVNRSNFIVSGAGKIRAFGVHAKDATATISGAGHIELTAVEDLKVDVSGAGKVYYKGHPTIVSEVSGAARVEDAN